MDSSDPQMLAEVLRHALDGIAVVDGAGANAPRVVYANATLAALIRRPEEALVGGPLDDIEVEAPADPTATGVGVGLRVRLKRVDGSLVECERWAILLPDGRLALHYRPLARSAPGALAAAVDRTSGLSTPEHLLEVLRRDWSVGQRDGRAITLMRFDLDAYREYYEVFGRVATENVLRQVGRTIGSAMRRLSDVVARFGDDEFVVLGVAMEPPGAILHAESILARVRALAIHHPRSRTGRYLTMSAGVVTAVPSRTSGCEALLDAAQQALARAKQAGGNQVAKGELPG
jgi:diguanylate cyclase (GGDEF)-like protein